MVHVDPGRLSFRGLLDLPSLLSVQGHQLVLLYLPSHIRPLYLYIQVSQGTLGVPCLHRDPALQLNLCLHKPHAPVWVHLAPSFLFLQENPEVLVSHSDLVVLCSHPSHGILGHLLLPDSLWALVGLVVHIYPACLSVHCFQDHQVVLGHLVVLYIPCLL